MRFFFKVMKQFEELWKTLSGQIWGFYTPEVKKYILIAFFYNPVENFFFLKKKNKKMFISLRNTDYKCLKFVSLIE